MEQSVKDKHIILGFVGFAILLISSIATLIVAEKFNQDNFVRLIVFVCSNLLGWLLYLSFQTVIFDTYEIYRIKFGKKKTPAEITEIREDQPQDAHKPVTPASMATGGEATPDIRPTEIAISPELHEKNRADYEDREQRENEERIAMVMEYIHFIMPRIADKETVNHICGEVNNWMRLHSYKPKPIKRTADQRHFKYSAPPFRVEYLRAFHVQEILYGDNRARFISTLFSTGVCRYGHSDHQELQGRAVKDTDSH